MHLKLVILAVTCFTASVQADATVPFHNFTTLPEALADIEKYILHFNETLNFPSLLFGLAVKGKTVMKKAYGIADLENGIQANVNNKYRLGSISKSFVSAVIGQLVDQGKIEYDDLVYKYLDAKHFPVKTFNQTAVNITIRQLLTHTAGIPGTDPMKDFFTVLDPPTNVTQQILRFKDQQLHRHPGGDFEYANNGYQILGAVIESITKKPFQQVMTEFLKKNKFPAAQIGDTSQIIHNVPRYYFGLDPKKPENMNNPMLARTKHNFPTCPYDDLVFLNGWWPAGGLLATLDDLFHYGQLMIDAYKGRPGAILSKKTVTQMWTGLADPKEVPTFVKAHYGFAWFVSDKSAQANAKLRHKNIIFHAGGLPGLSAQLTIYPDEEIVGVVFANKGVVLEKEQMVVYAVENLYHLVK